MITDKWLTRLFAFTVCILAVMASTTACYLFLKQLPVPDPLDRFLTFLVGALVGRITGSRTAEAGDSPMPTTLENTALNPVPTTDVAAPGENELPFK